MFPTRDFHDEYNSIFHLLATSLSSAFANIQLKHNKNVLKLRCTWMTMTIDRPQLRKSVKFGRRQKAKRGTQNSSASKPFSKTPLQSSSPAVGRKKRPGMTWMKATNRCQASSEPLSKYNLSDVRTTIYGEYFQVAL